MSRHRLLLQTTVLCALLLSACSPRVSLLGNPGDEPLKQSVLEGRGTDKVLVLPVSGFIDVEDSRGLVSRRPSVVREAAAVLRKAAKDKHIMALVVLIDSPGGTVAGSDMLYREIEAYRKTSNVKVVAQALTVCASGGYFTALSADEILATPASVVGSVGTVFVSPKVAGLMDKIGVGAEVTKSGPLKDMGSPFRSSTEEEKRLTQAMIDRMNALFQKTLASRRRMERAALDEVARAGVYTGEQALELGLVDALGYPREAVARAKALAGLPADAQVVEYRRGKRPDDTWYDMATAQWSGGVPGAAGPVLSLESLGLPVSAGFLWLWPQSLPGQGR